MSLFHCLGLLFIALKLTGHITWDWWLVVSPIVVVFSVVALVAGRKKWVELRAKQ